MEAAVAALAPPALAQDAVGQFPTGQVTYLANGLFQQMFPAGQGAAAADAADAHWRAAGLAAVWSLARTAGSNDRYITAVTTMPSGCQGAIACATIGCADNNSACRIWVLNSPSQLWDTSDGPPASGRDSLVGVLVHEKGHWAGLDHSAEQPLSDANVPTMVSGSANHDNERTIQGDDANGVLTARLGPDRNVAPNGGFESSRSEWGGSQHTMWGVAGTRGVDATLGIPYRSCGQGLAHSGVCSMGLSTGTGSIAGALSLYQVHDGYGSDGGSYDQGRWRTAEAWYYPLRVAW